MNKTESEDESEKMTEILKVNQLVGMLAEETRLEIKRLEKMLEAVIEEINALQKGDNTGLKHQNDGGWFD